MGNESTEQRISLPAEILQCLVEAFDGIALGDLGHSASLDGAGN